MCRRGTDGVITMVFRIGSEVEDVVLLQTTRHLLDNVLASAAEYEAAEAALSSAFQRHSDDPAAWSAEARTAKRKAAELAIAIDGLTDRASIDLKRSKTIVRTSVGALCVWPGGSPRTGCLGRVRAVANAYKHQDLTDKTLPIASDDDVLVVGLGYGLDGYGVGKFGGVEVIVRETAGTSWKFMGDAPIGILAWFRFIGVKGGRIAGGPHTVCGVRVYP